MALRAAGTIWVNQIRPLSNVGGSDSMCRRCEFGFDLRSNCDFDRFPERECRRLAVLAQRAITPVKDDEKPFTPEVEPSGAIDRVQDTESSVIHKDLNLLPSESVLLYFSSLSSC